MRYSKIRIRQMILLLSLFLYGTAAHAGTAFVHLFEWKWNDIANECENFLGPKGFEAVQISPPQEHVNHYTWWARYQPISFVNLNSRSGTEAELHSMVQRCDAAGVKIYADIVMNNWANNLDGGNIGSGGSIWWPRNYPELGPENFHPSCMIGGYGNAQEVWYCELYGMPDLYTGAEGPQQYVADYLRRLMDMGIAGFRIDAAKHIAPNDLDGILARAGRPWVFLEVIGAANEAHAIQPHNYTHLGQVTEFKYGTDLASNFHGQIRHLRTLGPSWGLLNSDQATVFVDNHDRERGHGGGGNLTYKDGARYNLANVFMLAFPYGYPKVMSGFNFTDTDAGPPAGASQCVPGSGWTCQHRWANIANMVGFRNHTIDAWSLDNWWDNGNNQIAFSRGDRGFVVINNENGPLHQQLYTGMPAGEYCNILAGEEPCSGAIITVNNNGYASFVVNGMQAAAIHGGAMVSSCPDCFQSNFPSLNFRGTANNWGTSTMTLVDDHLWEITVYMDGQANQRFKVDVHGDWSHNYGDNNSDGYLNQTGADIYTHAIGNYILQVNDNTLQYTLTPQ